MRTWLKQFVVPSLSTVLLITIACFATIWTRNAGLLRPAEFQVYDRWINERPTARQEDSPVLIVGMSEADINRFGYPISDRLMTDLLKKLLAAEPAAIGLDIYRDLPVPAEDKESRQNFLALVHANDFIIVPTKLSEHVDTAVLPPETFPVTPAEVHPQVANINTIYDPDGAVRRGLLYRAFNTKTTASVPTLGFSLANIYVQSPFFNRSSKRAFDPAADFLTFTEDRVAQHVKDVGPYHGRNVEDWGYPFLLDFRGPRDFAQESIARVMDGIVKPNEIKGRVVIIGVCASSSKDYVRSPLQIGGEDEFGAEHHARVADQLIRAARGDVVSMRFWSSRAETAWFFLFCALGSAVGWSARPPGRLFAGATGVLIAASAGAMVLVGLWVCAHSAFRDNLWIPVVPPAMGFILATGLVTLYSAVTGRRDRSAMMQLIGHYVSDDVAKLIWAERDQVFSKGRLRTRRLRGTVLFTDLRGFSTISEQLKAQDLMRWLNQYFQGLSDLVKQSGGIIMKFNGDQIVAVFGPPRSRTLEQCGVDARNAVRCALRMRQRLTRLNARWAKQNKPQAAMRIGIHTGWLVAGTLGSRQRMEWTVIGDTVNTAARLESVKKDMMPDDIAANGCRILISEATAKMLDLSFDVRPLGKLPLKGKRRRVLVHGVIGFVTMKRPPASVQTVGNISQKKD